MAKKEKSKKKALPTGQERMKRMPPTDFSLRPQKFEFDPRKAYSLEQLAEIGAIALRSNQIEAQIEFIGSHILFSKAPFWLQIATNNALSLKAKVALLRECMEHSTLLDDKIKDCINDSLAEVLQCRAYRNAIIHHHIYDHALGIGTFVDDAKKSYQILVSLDALTTLYKIMCSLLDEVREVDLLFRMVTDAQRPGQMDQKTRVFRPFEDDYLKANIIPDHVKRLMKLQRERKELHKLPHFPDADLIKSFNEREGGVGE